jgi:hypothetical protein
MAATRPVREKPLEVVRLGYASLEAAQMLTSLSVA